MISAFFIISGFFVAAGVFCYRMRRMSMRAHRRFVEATLPRLDSAYSLQPCTVRPDFQDLRPGRALGLLRFLADLRRGSRLRWVNRTDTTMLFGCMKMHTILFIPECGYNLPMLSIDIIFAGLRRVFVVEIIDAAGIPDELLNRHYLAMLRLKPPPDVMPEYPVTYWYRDLLAACSIHARLDAGSDDLMLVAYCAYLDAYARMVRDAQPAPDDTAEIMRNRQRWYVQSLIDHGGPAVDVLAKLLGRALARDYIWSTMFGYDDTTGRVPPRLQDHVR